VCGQLASDGTFFAIGRLLERKCATLAMTNWRPPLLMKSLLVVIESARIDKKSEPEGSLVCRFLFAAGTADAINLGLPLMGRVAVVGPLLPADVHFFAEEASLCQLQSHLGGELSVVPPTIGDELLVFGQASRYLIKF
jgi:hypothetical protein